jgi:hypothetical protein
MNPTTNVTPYLTSEEAKATTRRLKKLGLLDKNFWVQLLPTSLPESNAFHFVLRYYAAQDDELPVAQIHFMDGGKKYKSTVFIDQLQEVLAWRWGEFKPNFELIRKLPTQENTRRYKLQLLLQE